jgi:Cu/Zn superoxide dismutase
VFDGDGSAIIVHLNPDTYCPDGPVAGCAGGGRAACGVLEALSDDEDEWME